MISVGGIVKGISNFFGPGQHAMEQAIAPATTPTNAQSVSNIVGGSVNEAMGQANAKFLKWQEEQAQKANLWSAKQASIARDYNTQMSNSAHQREVKDLIKAGLNPMLSVMKGAGANTIASPMGQTTSAKGKEREIYDYRLAQSKVFANYAGIGKGVIGLAGLL